ncbi:hypothetical protein DBR28_03870 [Chryseobacterium sp. HMWF028]|nr:hypothetical protein DBR28_03870 [Chryseobacterium sp. HMWF028]
METLFEKLVGTWTLVELIEIPVNGSEITYPMGENPKELVMYNPDGYMSAQINQRDLNENLLMKLAKQLKLNIPQFEKDFESTELADKVDSDFESGIMNGVNGTPSFFVNGKKFDGGAKDLIELLRENTEN